MQVFPSLDEISDIGSEYKNIGLCHTLIADMESPMSILYKLKEENSPHFLLESIEGGLIPSRYSIMGVRIDGSIRIQKTPGGIECWLDEAPTTDCSQATQSAQFYKSEARLIADPILFLREYLYSRKLWLPPTTLPKFFGGILGYFGYECIEYFEEFTLSEKKNAVPMPDIYLFIAHEVIVFDHLLRRLTLIKIIPNDSSRIQSRNHYKRAVDRLRSLVAKIHTQQSPPNLPASPSLSENCHTKWQKKDSRLAFRDSVSYTGFANQVKRAKKSIASGEIFQIVLSFRQTVDQELNPLDLYRALRITNPSPYMFYIQFPNYALVGASPESLVANMNGSVTLNPIAGTRPRGLTLTEDLQMEQELLNSSKELAEHRMLVDLGRNDLGKIAKPNSVDIARPMHIEKYSHVMHLVTNLKASLLEGLDSLDVLQAAFPAGTVSGAPKIRACQIINEIESEKRNYYSGAVGYCSYPSNRTPLGNMDTCIALRTLLITKQATYLQAGAGIVADSTPEQEYQEILNKLKSGRHAVELCFAIAHS